MTVNSAGRTDLFLAKYTRHGQLDWAKSIGGSEYDEGRGIAHDMNNEVIVAGFYMDTLALGPGKFGTVRLMSSGETDIFLC